MELVEPARLGELDEVKRLIQQHVDVNTTNHSSQTALYCACESGRTDVAEYLLDSGANVNFGAKPLIAAVRNNRYDCVKVLLEHEASTSCTNSHQETPMSVAFKKKHYSIILLLLQYNATPLASLRDIALQLLQCAKVEHAKTILKLIDKKVIDLSSENTFLAVFYFAFKSSTFELAERMLLNDSYPKSIQVCQHAMYYSAKNNWPTLLSKLVEDGVNINVLTDGQTPLYAACKEQHESVVIFLLNNGADPNIPNTITTSASEELPFPIHIVAQQGNETILKALVRYRADVNASDEKGDTALHLATSSFAVEALLNAGAKVNAMNNSGDTALSMVCKRRKRDRRRRSVIEMLFKFGADPNIGFPLHTVCKNNDVDTVQLLLAYGVDANQVRRPKHVVGTKSNPLCIACTNGNMAIVDCLLRNRADTMFVDRERNSPLHFAVERLRKQTSSEQEQHDPIIALLLQHKAPVNVVSNSGETPLYMACMKGLIAVSKQLLCCSADVGLTTSNSKKYPLMIACKNKFRDIAMLLLERGADPNVSKDHQTPLKLAAGNGDVELVKKLITCGADVNQMRNIGDTALHIVTRTHQHGHQHRRFRDDTVVKKTCLVLVLLLKSGAEINSLNNKGETPLYLACRTANNALRPNLVIVQTLLEHGGDPNICPPSPDSSVSRCAALPGLPPLTAAVDRGNTELVLLLVKFGARLNHADVYGRTVLHYAIDDDKRVFARNSTSTKSNASTVEALLSAGADVNTLDSTGASALFLACAKGKTEFVKLLLSRDANPNNGTKEKLRIHTACRGLHYDATRLLLEYKADVTACDENGKTALHHALEFMSHFAANNNKGADLVQLLLEAGASVSVTSENGESPMYIVCSKGLISIAKKLLEFGAAVTVNSGERLPLIAACSGEHISVAQLLLTNGADPNVVEEGNVPLHMAARDDNSELVELLLKHGANVDVADSRGNTALHLAIQHCYHLTASSLYAATHAFSSGRSTVDILLENKADVNMLNCDGETSLLTACLRQDTELVDILLNHGSDPNLRVASASCDLAHKLPLFVTVDTCHIDIITLLLNAGADVNATDHTGRNVACIATKRLTSVRYCHPLETSRRLLAIYLLLQNGANVCVLLPVHLLVSVIPYTVHQHTSHVPELLQLMVEHGAMLMDPPSQLGTGSSRAFDSGTLAVLATCKHKFIVDMFRAGAGFQLLASCCRAVRSFMPVKSIALCQAVVLAGYVPNAEELSSLQMTAATDNMAHGLLKQLVEWLSEDRRQVPSLFRQCRVAIRRQLSTAAQYRTILPAIDQLPLPDKLKLYLQFDGSLSEVDLSVQEEPGPQNVETDDEISA